MYIYIQDASSVSPNAQIIKHRPVQSTKLKDGDSSARAVDRNSSSSSSSSSSVRAVRCCSMSLSSNSPQGLIH